MKNKIYEIKFTNSFKKQYAKVKKQSNFKQEKFNEVIQMLSTNQILPKKNKNHLLEPKSKRNMGVPYST